MRIFYSAACACILLGSALCQSTPPGADQVGSDHHLQQGQSTQQPINNPRENQDETDANGSNTGRTGPAAVTGDGTADRTNTQSPAAAGQSEETGVAAARRSAGERSAQERKAGIKPGDNGSVWNSNTQRDSNIVEKMSGSGKPAAQSKSTTTQKKDVKRKQTRTEASSPQR
jgi:hypothetical protein